MDIVIHLDRVEPPAGTILVRDEAAPRQHPFEGWLAMVGALYELLGAEASERHQA